jgi:protein involved in polysaccharide export with SLBB domain
VTLASGSCRTLEDPRVFEVMNRRSFGKRYDGDAQVANYLRVGDAITVVSVTDPDELTVPMEVIDVDGTVVLPEIGTLRVAGLTREESQRLIRDRYALVFNEEFAESVELRMAAEPKNYIVLGEVGNKGIQPFIADMTLAEAVLMSQPDDSTANLGAVRIIRGDPVDPFVIEVDVNAILLDGDTTYNVIVKENDIVYVPPTAMAALGNWLARVTAPVTKLTSSIGNIMMPLLFGIGGGAGTGAFF